MKFSWGADHFAYLPSIGLVGLTVAGVQRLYTTLSLHLGRILLGIIAAVMLALSCATRDYAGVFASEKSLWERTISRNPQAQSMLEKMHQLEEAVAPAAPSATP